MERRCKTKKETWDDQETVLVLSTAKPSPQVSGNYSSLGSCISYSTAEVLQQGIDVPVSCSEHVRPEDALVVKRHCR